MSVSGSINFPDYMKIIHSDWLANTDPTGLSPVPQKLTTSVTEAVEAAHSANPYTGEAAFNPSTQLGNMITAISAYQTIINAMNYQTDYASFVSAAVADTTGVTEFSATLDDQITTKVLPRYFGGMRDINAVQSSAFIIGQGVIEAFKQRDVANFQAKKVLDNIKDVMKLYLTNIEANKIIMATKLEAYRINIVASKEEVDRQVTLDEGDSRWDLEVFQYGANLMASISGSSANPGTNSATPSSTQSAIGGALSGAALGYSITGSGTGAAVGAGLGLLGSLL